MTADGHATIVDAPPKSEGSRLRTLGVWAFALLIAIAGFFVGRATAGLHHLPALAATLPGDESEFNHEIDERVRELFPIGTSDEKLIAYLSAQGFTPEWRERDYANAASYTWSGVLCAKIVRVIWRADSDGALTAVNGSYKSQCVF